MSNVIRKKVSKKVEAAFLVYGNTLKPVGEIIEDLTDSIIGIFAKANEDQINSLNEYLLIKPKKKIR